MPERKSPELLRRASARRRSAAKRREVFVYPGAELFFVQLAILCCVPILEPIGKGPGHFRLCDFPILICIHRIQEHAAQKHSRSKCAPRAASPAAKAKWSQDLSLG